MRLSPAPVRRSHTGFSLSFGAPSVLALLLAACGARGPIDFEVVNVTVAGTDASTAPVANQTDAGAPPVASSDASTGTPGTPTSPGIPGLSDDGGPISCLTCAGTQCGGAIATCLQDTTCGPTLQCLLTSCLGGLAGGGTGTGGGTGGGASCLASCGGGGIAGLAPLLPILECITSSCGSQCGGLLGGLGGGLGGLGGGLGG